MDKSILLIKVGPTVRFAVRNAIANTGFKLSKEARTYNEGIHRFQIDHPSGAVMDMTLSPHETLRAVRHFHKRFPTSRVLVIYNHVSRPNLVEARRAGVKESVAFPFSSNHFLSALTRMVGPANSTEKKTQVDY